VKATAVIGANFGDEGKGLIVDYLCSKGDAGMVVRFNGGAQAGHTVVTPDGQRHVFHHFGAGSFCGVPTYLSKYFICNPLLFFEELDALHKLGLNPTVYAHPDCLITTYADMMINQALEDQRGANRHGSCGVGVNETVKRSALPGLSITMSDLWNRAGSIERKLEEICDKYSRFRTGKTVDRPEFPEWFIKGCWRFAEVVHPLGIEQCRDPVFEGAQGLLLDQDNKQFFPHVTRSSTGMKNVRKLCAAAGITDIETYYVTRTYLTRHGAGDLPNEDRGLKFEDDTNLEHAYQGTLRFAPMDWGNLPGRCATDYGSDGYWLAITHADQNAWHDGLHLGLVSHGPCRTQVSPMAATKRLRVATA